MGTMTILNNSYAPAYLYLYRGSDDDKVLQIDQPEGQRIEGAELDGRHLEQEVKDLRERVRAMMYEVSEAKRLQQGWQVM